MCMPSGLYSVLCSDRSLCRMHTLSGFRQSSGVGTAAAWASHAVCSTCTSGCLQREDIRTLLTEQHKEHAVVLRNPSPANRARHTEVDERVLDDIPKLPDMDSLDNLPTIEEVTAALGSLKTARLRDRTRYMAKSSGTLPAGIQAVYHSNGRMQTIYKEKEDRATCSNSRGISLLSSAGKVLTRIMLLRLIQAVAEEVLPESQCGFRKDCSTVDMIFVLRQLQVQEKCREQHQDLYMVFIDLTKAFDTVNRPLLWEVLKRFGCPNRFLTVLKALHEGAMVRVLGNGSKSDPFQFCTGVRQGCVIALVIFNLFLAAVMLAAKKRINHKDCISITYRLDGNLFNLRRLKAHTRVTHQEILELQYADDAAITGHTTAGLQNNLDILDDTYT
ncbi:hypothetical protein Bbelb_110940 [Branchiostoma belcheri]|nr:hypothetical protein Bbelb_110940 [Branchiostoma belcheri]